ncbi:hypothetical protein DENIS_0555 [Desulfonema ishimotonii]|uniref:Uncharacterized protein n=1 Tax=Desulfonema ishimotonii TaxID=45657 RepID=A0A401FRM5_9BACT|nr:hypothetical protein DENIS_0555 [Desulfonema ishimotonii]
MALKNCKTEEDTTDSALPPFYGISTDCMVLENQWEDGAVRQPRTEAPALTLSPTDTSGRKSGGR